MQLGMISQPIYSTKTYVIKSLLSFRMTKNRISLKRHLWDKKKNLRTELKEHRVNALEGNQKTIDLNQKGRQNATRFCGYCRTNGHTPSFCRKKIRDEEVKKLQNEATAQKKVTFTHDYNKKRGPSHGSGNCTSRKGDNGPMISTPNLTQVEI